MPRKRYQTIRLMAVAALVPFGRRARVHSDDQVAAIARAIERFRFINPILVDERDRVLCGWGRVLAARRLGLETISTLRIDHLDDDEKRAYVLADNQLAISAEWDNDLLRIEFEELAAAGMDLSVIGFDDEQIDSVLFPSAADGNADDAPPTPKNPVTKPGDVWLLGGHRLICGDATNPDHVARVLAGAAPRLMATDPPYGVNYDPSWRAVLHDGHELAKGKVANDHRADWREAWALFKGAVVYVWHGGLHCAAVQASLDAHRFRVRAHIVWVKQRPVISRGAYHYQHEPALFAVREGEDDGWRYIEEHDVATYAVADGETAHWRGGRKQTSVWFIDHFKNETGHGTQKPVECMRRPMLNHTRRGDAVYEPFCGSGTSIIAAQTIERECRAIEIDPAYCDVTVERWQQFTGQSARREGRSSRRAGKPKCRQSRRARSPTRSRSTTRS